jgi:uncharacterized protein YfaS (alpha-2-macroglobulin family)
MNVTVDPVRIDGGSVLVGGSVSIDDDVPLERIGETVSSPELGKPSWSHENGLHKFRFAPVSRTGASRDVEIRWTGQPAGSRDGGSATVRIPGSAVFEMVSALESGGVLEVSFSNTIRRYPDLRGFVSLSGNTNVRASQEGNSIRIFGLSGSEGIPAGAEVLIQDIEDTDGNALAEPVRYRMNERWELPEVRFAGAGTILPTSQGSAAAVETKNVSGVLVEAFRIDGNNMTQFLQVNGMEGTRELDRVGEPAWTGAFDFAWSAADKNRWVRRGLDLSELAKKYPGGVFRIRLSFRRRHVRYECDAGHGDFSNLEFPDDSFPSYRISGGEPGYWDLYQNSPGFSWQEWNNRRKDPCHPAFYISYWDHNITVGRNILVSDLGLLAKRGLDGRWVLAATNLRTAQPAADAEVRVLNYQGRVLYQGRTGNDGMAQVPDPGSLSAPGEAAFIYAQTGFGRNWLRVNDSLALAVSHFDLAGDRPLSGMRGLIYGERGVWRPGDTICLTFLLADPSGSLPANHPVNFELEDPRGRITWSQTCGSPVDGFYPVTAATAPDAPTGDWLVRVRAGGAVFTKTLKIETVMPNRLKMDLDFGPKSYIDGASPETNLEAAWLYGAPASGLKADISVSFADQETAFPGYGDYSFRDPSRAVSAERQTLWEGTLDDAGRARFPLHLNPGSAAPGKLSARFMTRVFEPSGVFSSEQTARDFSPYRRYVGIRLPRGDAVRNMLPADKDHRAEIAVLDGDGKPVSGNVTLNCALYKVSWRWWWERGGSEAAEFASTLSRSPVMEGTVTASNGRAAWNFRVNHPGWGRYLVIARDAEGGHAGAAFVYIDWPGPAGREQEGGQGAPVMLALSPSKTAYNTGEKISVRFPSNREAAALVTVEKGGRIIRNVWVPCADTSTVYEFTAEPSMVPNVYVHVTLLQPHLQTRNDLPIRLYGISRVLVEDSRTVLQPRISAPETWLPESTASFTVSEAGGRAMTYTVAVVDEGLLGLTRYRVPNPAATFYAQEASFLKSWDLYASVMGAWSGNLETLLAIGGGDDGILEGGKQPERFRPVVRCFGPYELGAGATRQESFDLPPYAGALRIMVLAASPLREAGGASAAPRAYGTAEKSVQVASDLMVFGSVPRTLSPGDQAEIPVTVASAKSGARTVRVSLSLAGTAGAQIQGASTQNVGFDRAGEKTIRFTVKAPDVPGSLRFAIAAESAGLRAASHVTDLEVRSTAIPVTRSALGFIAPGETWTGSIDYPGRPATNTALLELSRFPPLNLEKRLEYLVTYPHGCIEQTASAAFPQLYLDRIMELEPARRTETRANIAAAIERITGFQTADGGFSYWPGGEDPHSWGSTYAGHFLLEARRAGYAVNAAVMGKWLHFQKNRAALWQNRSGGSEESAGVSPVDQAYRLYTIALAGEADLGSMNRLREIRNLDSRAAWRLAAAYWYAGQRDTARSMIRNLGVPGDNYRELSGTFGSTLRDKAMILEVMVLIGDSARTRPLFEEISAALSADSWLSTQETAYSLIAMTPWVASAAGAAGAASAAGATGAAGANTAVNLNLAGQDKSLSFASPTAQFDLGAVSGGSGAYRLRNNAAIPVYARLTVRGLPQEGAEPPLAEGLELNAGYFDMNGRAIDPAALKPGEDMEVRITLRNSWDREVPEIALIAPLPASWEILNYRLAGSAASTGLKYQDIRDDRVTSYFDLGRGQSRTVSFRVNRTYGGNYFRPAIHAYAMYNESIRALSPGVR